eukprot:13210165-Ditylum_brightwellii.AAC.1
MINYIKGAFLKGNLDQQSKHVYMKVPQSFERFALKAIYGTKQAVMAFWKDLLECKKDIKYEINGADP